MKFVEQLMSWGPVVFGVLMLGPMLAAVLDALHLVIPVGGSNLAACMVLGFFLGLLARWRGSWI